MSANTTSSNSGASARIFAITDPWAPAPITHVFMMLSRLVEFLTWNSAAYMSAYIRSMVCKYLSRCSTRFKDVGEMD